jgi:hypothetical protein
MINWRNGKAGFVGGLKYIIKGVFQFAHSITTTSTETEKASFAIESEISSDGQGVLSAITTAGEAVVAGLVSGKGVRSVISSDGIGVINKFQG